MEMVSPHERAVNAAGLSLLYPGAGQAVQGRSLTALWHGLEFTAMLIGAIAQPSHRTGWLIAAGLLGVYSVVDAFRYDRRRHSEPRAI